MVYMSRVSFSPRNHKHQNRNNIATAGTMVFSQYYFVANNPLSMKCDPYTHSLFDWRMSACKEIYMSSFFWSVEISIAVEVIKTYRSLGCTKSMNARPNHTSFGKPRLSVRLAVVDTMTPSCIEIAQQKLSC